MTPVEAVTAFTALFVLIDVALAATSAQRRAARTSPRSAGYFAFSLVVVGACLYFEAMSSATGGKSLPMGSPGVH